MSNFYVNSKSNHLKNLLYTLIFLCMLLPILLYAAVHTNMSKSEHTENTMVQHHVLSSIVEKNTQELLCQDVETTASLSVTPLIQTLTGSSQTTNQLVCDTQDLSFFEHSVFVGDSISVGFEAYCQSHTDSILTDTTYFLARVSCSAKVLISDNALTAHADVVPLYEGVPQYVEDSIAQMTDIEKVFLCFGVNDLVACAPEEYINNVQTLASRILEKNPGITIYMISVPCVDASVTTGYLNNDAIHTANALLQEACTENGWGFINLTEYIMNESGAICQEYSSDGYVHENNLAYDIWTKVLKNYAHEGKTT